MESGRMFETPYLLILHTFQPFSTQPQQQWKCVYDELSVHVRVQQLALASLTGTKVPKQPSKLM